MLVAYASRFGATREIAERIGERLRVAGLEADVRSVDAAGDLAGYEAFVVGSAVFAGHWMQEASDFVRSNRVVLADRPVWLFSSGPVGTMATKHDPVEPKEIPGLKRALKPRDHRVFFGAWSRDNLGRSELGFGERIAVKFLSEGDYRNWAEIEAWTKVIAADLGRNGGKGSA